VVADAIAAGEREARGAGFGRRRALAAEGLRDSAPVFPGPTPIGLLTTNSFVQTECVETESAKRNLSAEPVSGSLRILTVNLLLTNLIHVHATRFHLEPVLITHRTLRVRVYVVLHLQIVEHVKIGIQIIVAIESLQIADSGTRLHGQT